MASSTAFDPDLIRGLEALAATTFPKRCRCCGRSFTDVADYVAQTHAMPNGAQGLKQSLGDDGHVVVDLFRNCPCGSTLMDSFSDRRDTSAQGEARRLRFNELMAYLQSRGLAAEVARHELLEVMHGRPSAILTQIRPPATGKTKHA
ncbi:oxidoreductase [Ferribacterium limneticum]|uniref:oxidoreductase n=1 Tax=Ferribacterium limneticum TaxID=76259 RepID=UPI001CF92B5A|nr:oxidoreductase [Ferribacterium limneticum]UCV23056.1 oxidoreductase [Ferribacterium limneticum]